MKHDVNDNPKFKPFSIDYKSLFEKMQEGFAVHKIILDDKNHPIDYLFLDVNPAFEKLTGFKRESTIGKTIKELLPGIDAQWIHIYGEVAISGKDKLFEAFSKELNKHYRIYAYSPYHQLFAIHFSDITRRVNAEEGLRNANETLELKVIQKTLDLQSANQELYAMNLENASLNQALCKINENLEQRVWENTLELRTALEIQSMLLEVSKITQQDLSSKELFYTINALIKEVLPISSISVSLLEKQNKHYNHPLIIDETDNLSLTSNANNNSLVDYVLQTQHAVFFSAEDLTALEKQGKLSIGRVKFKYWAGIPLLCSKNKPLGVVSVFSISSEFNNSKDKYLDALRIIATQISQALERNQANQKLQDSEERFRLSMNFSDIGYVDVNLQTRTIVLSENWLTRLGLAVTTNPFPWKTILKLIHPKDITNVYSSVATYLKSSSDGHSLECRLKLPNHTWTWVLIKLKSTCTLSRTTSRLLGTISDISSLRKREECERFRAEHDDLTGLLNRQGISTRAAKLFQDHNACALALIDIDNFDLINAVHGRETGDQFLVEFSALLKKVLGNISHIARYSSDEFLLLFPGKFSEASLIKSIESLDSNWIETKAGRFFVHLSCGITTSLKSSLLSTLTQQAALALKHAKAQGKRRVCVFTPSMQESLKRQHLIRELLNQSLSSKEHYLAFQPIYNTLEDKHILLGYEALLRWKNHLLGHVSPAEFIPLAESTGQIEAIGKWVLEEACDFLFQWKRKTGSFVIISVNISALQLVQPGFCEMICDTLHRFKIPGNFLKLEVTESVLITDMKKNATILSNLRQCGVGISLDDFGTGYSSFIYLTKLPVTSLKIDKTLTQEIGNDSNNKNRVLLETVFHMANFLKYDVVIEGVETAEQLAAVQSIGFHQIQGYYLGKPMPKEHYLKNTV